ncbi:MAG: hypothetical protein OEY14_01545 [Myxococcales bacterium]|nr:hypothetical protein [Myxococcales bacterium]
MSRSQPISLSTILAALTLAGALGASSSAAAQSARFRGANVLPYAERHTTMERGTFRIDLGPPDHSLLDSGDLGNGYGLRYQHDDRAGVPNRLLLGVGVAYAFTSEFELGLQLLPLRFDPSEYGDLEAYLRYSLVLGAVDVALQGVLQMPTEHALGLAFGVPIFLHLGDVARLELGLELELALHGFHHTHSDDTWLSLDFPAALALQLTEFLYVGVRSGLQYLDLERVVIPLGGFVGATLGRGSAADLSCGLTAFLPDGGGAVEQHASWELTFGLNLHIGR